MNLLVIRDDKPGHYNQSEGLVLYLKEIYKEINVEYIEVKIKSKLSRKILRILLNNFDSFFCNENSLKYIRLFYKKYNLPFLKPDMIISTGGNTSNINAWLAKVYKSKNILNGALRGLKEELFSYVSTVIDLGYRNQIILDVAPSLINENDLKRESEKFLALKKLNKNCTFYSLLIGGNGSGYIYDKEFYINLVTFAKKISKEKNIKWLVTTSRRTPIEFESFLEKELIDFSEYFVSYNKKEEKVLQAFLGLSKMVFVTEESSSMISEAISAKKPVFTIGKLGAKPDNNYLTILNKFSDNKYIKRLILDDKKLFDFKIFDTKRFFLLNEINLDFKKVFKK